MPFQLYNPLGHVASYYSSQQPERLVFQTVQSHPQYRLFTVFFLKAEGYSSAPYSMHPPHCFIVHVECIQTYFWITSSIFCPISAGDSTVWMPASCKAAYFSCAVPFPPEMIAPACPMRFPGGAVTPAI